MSLWRELGNDTHLAYTLEALGELAFSRNQQTRAAELFGAAEKLRESIGSMLSPTERADRQNVIHALASAMPEEKYREAYDRGRSIRLEQALESAIPS